MQPSTQAGVFILLMSVFLYGCGGPDTPPAKVQPAEVAPVTYSQNAMTAAERQEFYHLHEGSELFPVAWILHMQSPRTQRPFIENLERFGLIPDPDGPLFEGTQIRMPVGVAVKERDGMEALKAVGLSKMVGVNCAACHVGQLEYNNTRLRIDGAPNLFDIVGFLQEIKDTATATYTNPKRLWAYLKARRSAAAAARDFDALKQGEAHEKAAAQHLENIAADSDVNTADVDRIKNDSTLAAELRDHLAHIAEEIRLMKSYITLIENFGLAQNPETVSGFGRADAFGTARVLLFGKPNMQPLSAPSSFPFIWNMKKTAWFHWPANTNSVLQRNIGEALGLGASFVPGNRRVHDRFLQPIPDGTTRLQNEPAQMARRYLWPNRQSEGRPR